MVGRIEDYALIGDTHTAALVGNDGSIDWLCLPRFDSGAAFAALLGTPDDHGRWLLTPAGGVQRVERAYRDGTLVLETTFHTDDGVVRIIDCMPIRGDAPSTSCASSKGCPVACRCAWTSASASTTARSLPWVRTARRRACTRRPDPNALVLRRRTSRPAASGTRHRRRLRGRAPAIGCRSCWPGTRRTSRRRRPINAQRAVERRRRRGGGGGRSSARYEGPWRDAGDALADHAQGADLRADRRDRRRPDHVAARVDRQRPQLGLPLLLAARLRAHPRRAHRRPASTTRRRAWRDWLLRAVAGDPAQLQIMYGARRRAPARPSSTLDWLPGYEGSAPVRVGNAASGQFQLDVYGEVLDSLHHDAPRVAGRRRRPQLVAVRGRAARVPRGAWHEPDDGHLGGRAAAAQHFTHSKVMAWVAFDSGGAIGRAVRPRRARRSLAGGCATRSTPRCAPRASTRRSTRSPSRTGRSSSTPSC